MPIITIVSRINGAVLYTGQGETFGLVLAEAVRFGVDLRYADLRNRDICSLDLSGARLSSADIRGSCLIGCNLTGADLGFADLTNANLYGCNLTGANTVGAMVAGASFVNAIGYYGTLPRPKRDCAPCRDSDCDCIFDGVS